MTRRLGIGLLVLAACPAARGELRDLVVTSRVPFVGGADFGTAGPYEVLTGVARFAVDPTHPRNRAVVDLPLALTAADGTVRFEADVCILAPKNLTRGNGAILYDVHNRGNKLALKHFNSAHGANDLTAAGADGNGFLLRRGYAVVWSGWSSDVLPGNGRLVLRVPTAVENDKPVRGVVRYELATDEPADSLPLARREGHGSYPPVADGTLTWRMRESDPRVPIPRGQWTLERVPIPSNGAGVPGSIGQVRLKLAGGFRPGYLYELVCEAEGSVVQGLGSAGVRDLVSFLRNDNSPKNPLRGAVTRTHAFGVSQSGRFLRTFLHDGFNADEAGRRVFDGLFPHVAGGGLGSFNHRFAQPTRMNGQHEEHLYPVDQFPFAYADDVDPFTKRTDSVLSRADPGTVPKVVHTHSAAEYWHRSGSLVHTDPLGTRDVDIPANVRIYAFGGTQHSPALGPPTRGVAENLLNPADFAPFQRALLDALDAWVRADQPPPPSVYPRVAAGTLVPFQDAGFPAISGVRYPEVIQRPSALDFGPEFLSRGIITVEPPRVLGHYAVKVPKAGPDGNDLGTLLLPEVAVPLATYTGWNLRRRDVGAEGMLALLMGSYLPFPKTRAERLAVGDPRESVAERYGTFAEYRRRYAAACADLRRDGYLLDEDVDRLLAGRKKARNVFPNE